MPPGGGHISSLPAISGGSFFAFFAKSVSPE
jgi:hypothetical protein